MIQAVHLEDVRCFRGPTKIPLRPLTFFVGENSAGKSTALALIRAAWECTYTRAQPSFNEEPFALGAYEHIAHFHGGRGKRTKSFSIGITDGSDKMPFTVISTFTDDNGQPRLQTWELSTQTTKITMQLAGESAGQVSLTSGGTMLSMPRNLSEVRVGTRLDQSPADILRFLFFRLSSDDRAKQLLDDQALTEGQREQLRHDLRAITFSIKMSEGHRPYAMSPIRTRPKRTYDPSGEGPSPEGSHAPSALANLLNPKGPKKQQQRKGAIFDFGKEAGLFTQVGVRALGTRKSSDPFQLTIRLPGQQGDRNIIDVGYGVSQVLPVLVDLLETPSETLLLQQPEVHLHPRAQAELGSLLATRTSAHQRLVVETHSDFLIDRALLEVQSGRLACTDICIVYFEKCESGSVKVHPIDIDSNGVVTNPPSSYRQFFLHEQERLLGGDVHNP